MFYERKNYKFIDNETGEIFFVNCAYLETAIETAHDYFDDPEYLDEICDDDEAEMLGYDTY